MEMMKGAINKKDWSRICTMVPHRYAGDLPMGMVIALLWTAGLSKSACAQSSYHPTIPKVWDEVALRDWATPIAGLNLRPTHISPEQYYSIPIENLRTYPVYLPGREPAGYWEMLQHVGPQPLIEHRIANERERLDRCWPPGVRASGPYAPAHLRSQVC